MRFNQFIDEVLAYEGGYQNHPADMGNYHPRTGELIGTNFGIAAYYFPEEDIKNLTIERAREIYEDEFYNSRRIGLLPAHLRFTVFDMGINAGSWRAVVGLQMLSQYPDPTRLQMKRCVNVMLKRERPGSVNLLAIDGAIGPRTATAAHNVTLEEYTQLREAYYKEIAKFRNNAVFLNGWLKRARKAQTFTVKTLRAERLAAQSSKA